MNKIYISEEQMPKIMAWKEKNRDLVRSYKPFLLNGVINYYDTMLVKFDVEPIGDNWAIHFNTKIKIDEQFVHVADFGIKTCDGGFTLDEINVDDINHDERIVEYIKMCGADPNFFVDCSGCYFSVNAYFFHYRQDVEEVPIKEVGKHLVLGKNKTYKTQYIKKLNINYRIVGKIRRNTIPKHRQWHIDCWGVVGHIRHYKNGKEVYIKPYTKGKNRLEETTKTYIIGD